MYFSPYNPMGAPFEGNVGGDDWDNYMTSLHMPKEFWEDIDDNQMTYNNIVGEDRPGTFRERTVDFIPIEVVATSANLPSEEELPTLIQTSDVLYYVHDSGDWYHWDGSSWGTANSGFVNKVKSDKAYIDMPNEWHRTFLNPRTVSVGVRVSF